MSFSLEQVRTTSSRSAELRPARLGAFGFAFNASSCLRKQALYLAGPCDRRSEAQVSSAASLSGFFKPDRSGSVVSCACGGAPLAGTAPGIVPVTEADSDTGELPDDAELPGELSAAGSPVSGSAPGVAFDAPAFGVPVTLSCAASTGVITKTGMSPVLPSMRSSEKRLSVAGSLRRASPLPPSSVHMPTQSEAPAPA